MLVRISLILALTTVGLSAETATRATPVHANPRAESAVLLLVKPGEDIPESAPALGAPAGWNAVSLPGPHEVYVENRYIGKDLDVKPGSPLRTSPKSDAPVLADFALGDEMEITGLRGRWTQLRISKSITGYIQGPSVPSISRTAPEITSAQLRDASNIGLAPAPTSPRSRMGHAVTRSQEERTSLAALPRLFEGRLASTRAPLRPRRPYDFALETENGVRFAYVDLTKLLLTEQIEKYLDHSVVVLSLIHI